ncbi:hypothetical protein D9Q98_003162 [Chlorella vulgaris]|uniref:Protein kinase domain-containing protein n=1 Tax=Chlorella vulgaris TaxID=3077 RepID=A0A9D4TSI2_CHLVU|nr:hypothetical protein D9Q98_003162 [Chlorella vulgaris]
MLHVCRADECSSVNRGAIVDLIREADLLSCMRHPNVVWVYGIVLPPLPDDEQEARGPGQAGSHGDSAECAPEDVSRATDRAASGGASSSASRPKSDVVDVIASGIRRSGVAPGVVRPPALVTEYMAGGSLKMALARRADIVAGPLTRVVLALDAAKGMEYLHSKSLVHFDLKTANLLLGHRDRRPICKVADFGLSKQKMDTFVTGVSSQRGTLPWTAPEILRTPEAVTEKVDVFSFGIVMWELDTGLEPYHGQNYHALLLRLANPREQLRPPLPGGPDWEGDVPPELAPGWRALMQRCWAEDPTCRPPFSEIIQELRCMASALKANRDNC